MFTESDYCPIREEKLSNILFSLAGTETFCPGLDRIRPLFQYFTDEFQRKKIRIVTVGGTNGKGETCYTLSRYLVNSGISCGCWSSPHILSIRERFLFNDQNVGYDELEEAVLQVNNKAELLSIKLSYYELLFATFCQLAVDRDLRYLIFEVGLGGRFDAVNLFNPEITAITSISRDHQAILGPRLRDILHEKLGITRKGVPLLSFVESSYLRELSLKFCNREEVPFFDLQNDYPDLTDYSDRNRVLAHHLFTWLIDGKYIPFSSAQLLEKKEIVSFKGRKERVTYGERNYIFIGAHNVDGMRKLVDSNFEFSEVLLSFSNRPLTDMRVATQMLVDAGIKVFLTSFEHPKAATSSDLKQIPAVEFIEDWKLFIRTRIEKGVTLVAGSYYFIGEVQKFMSRNAD